MSYLEETVPTSIPKIRIVRGTEPDVAQLTSGLDWLGAAVAVGNSDDAVAGVCRLVTECVSPLRERGAIAARMEG